MAKGYLNGLMLGAGFLTILTLSITIGFAADILTVDKDGTIRLRVSDAGKVTLNASTTTEGDMRFTPRTSDPTAPLAGDLWYNDTVKEVKYSDGGITKPLAETTNADISLYVDGTNGNDNNNGLTSGTAVKTIQKAVNLVPPIVRHAVTVNVAAGTYSDVGATIDGKDACVYVADKHLSASGSITFKGAAAIADAPNYRLTGAATRYYGLYINGVVNVHPQGLQCDNFLLYGIWYDRAVGNPLNCVSNSNKAAGIFFSNGGIGSPNTCTASDNGVGVGATWPKTGIAYNRACSGNPTSCTTNSNGESGIRYVSSYGSPLSCTADSNTMEGIKYVHCSVGSPTNCSTSSNVNGILYAFNSTGLPVNNTSTANNTGYGIYSDNGSMADYSGTTPNGNTAATGANAANYAQCY